MEDTPKYMSLVCEIFSSEKMEMLLYAIKFRHFKILDVEKLHQSVKDAIYNLEAEKISFQEFLEQQFPQYTTNQNDYPDKMSRIMQQLSCHLTPIKNIKDNFSTKMHHAITDCREHGLPPKQIIDTSMPTHGAYQYDIFGLNSFPEEVKALFKDIAKIYILVNEMEKMAHDAIEEEKNVRANGDLVMALFEDFRKEFMKEISDLLDLFANIPPSNILNGNDLYKATKKAPSYMAALQDKYHNISPKTVKYYFLGEFLNKKRQLDITDDEQHAWPADRESMLKARIVIDNFDILVPKGTKDKEFTMYTYMFCAWANGSSTRATYKCFRSRYRGTHKLRVYNTINGYSQKLDRKSAIYKQFTQAIETLLNKPENKKLWSQDNG